ncbi:MAG TPA: MarR family transcriptional regulator [Nocardioidaceae bacterium]|jgi:DNA-binding MarR family transcriptional regulator|nr:MarR family transcriptional regulator [Nocardioidaceae bacterium]
MTERQTSGPGRRGQRLTYLVKRLEMAERARMDEVLRPLGVTLHQYTALSILERREGLSSAQLARRHYVTPQAMHQLVASMERDGLIQRRPDEANRRILRAWLTEHGAEVLRACHDVVDRLEARMLSALTLAEAAVFERALGQCLAALTEPDAKGSGPGPADVQAYGA